MIWRVTLFVALVIAGVWIGIYFAGYGGNCC
jgi:hypothetical protein